MAYGGKRIGKIQLLERPYEERLGDMPPADLIREGGMCQSVEQFIDRYFDSNADQMVTVVRFSYSLSPIPYSLSPNPYSLSPNSNSKQSKLKTQKLKPLQGKRLNEL